MANSLNFKPTACMFSASHLQITGRLPFKVATLLGADEVECDTPCPCPNNLCNGLVERQRILDADRPFEIERRHAEGYKQSLRELYRRLRKSNGNAPTLTRLQVCQRYTGAKKLHYLRCHQELETWGYTHRTFCPIHVKIGERNHRPRVIIPMACKCRGTVPNPSDEWVHDDEARPLRTRAGETLLIPILVESPFRQQLETNLHSIRNSNGSRMFASGRSLAQRARDIRAMFPTGWKCLSIDLKSFDGSQGYLAEWERDECLRHFKDHPEINDLKRVFRNQRDLSCVDSTGRLKARIQMNRASGTAGTSVGNKIVMMSALNYCFAKSVSTRRMHFYCDGDDTLIFVHPENMQYVDSGMRRMGRLGLEVKVENVAGRPEDVVFCRSKIASGEHGEMLVKIPPDAFRTMCGVVRHFKGDHLLNYFATMKDGYSRLWSGVPVMFKLASIFGSGGLADYRLFNNDDMYKIGCRGNDPHVPPTHAARSRFAEAFGIGIPVQLQVEELCEQIGKAMAPLVREYTSRRRQKIITIAY